MAEIDLTSTINSDGLTLGDLLVTLIKECGKQGFMIAGAIIDPNKPNKARTFGQGNLETIHSVLTIGAEYTKNKGNVTETKRYKLETN